MTQVIAIERQLSDSELDLLARMHIEALPESLVSLLGVAYARTFYRYVIASNEERLLTCRDEGQLVGACLLSLAPESLPRRLLTATPFLLYAPRAWRRLPVRALLKGGDAERPTAPGPEILLIFTVDNARGQGIGGKLLAQGEALAKKCGHARMRVKTRDDRRNRAIGFYQRSGYGSRGTIEKFGKKLVVFEKELHGDASSI
jgi:GNAT superfamily N-acetyltransferase